MITLNNLVKDVDEELKQKAFDQHREKLANDLHLTSSKLLEHFEKTP